MSSSKVATFKNNRSESTIRSFRDRSRADIFEIGPELGRFDIIYDRAALIALSPDTRKRYVDICGALSGVTLLITIAYDQSKASGPPFSVEERVVHELHANKTIEKLDTRPANIPPRLRDEGVEFAEESVYFIRA